MIQLDKNWYLVDEIKENKFTESGIEIIRQRKDFHIECLVKGVPKESDIDDIEVGDKVLCERRGSQTEHGIFIHSDNIVAKI